MAEDRVDLGRADGCSRDHDQDSDTHAHWRVALDSAVQFGGVAHPLCLVLLAKALKQGLKVQLGPVCRLALWLPARHTAREAAAQAFQNLVRREVAEDELHRVRTSREPTTRHRLEHKLHRQLHCGLNRGLGDKAQDAGRWTLDGRGTGCESQLTFPCGKVN